jgi:hypothetical protein
MVVAIGQAVRQAGCVPAAEFFARWSSAKACDHGGRRCVGCRDQNHREALALERIGAQPVAGAFILRAAPAFKAIFVNQMDGNRARMPVGKKHVLGVSGKDDRGGLRAAVKDIAGSISEWDFTLYESS